VADRRAAGSIKRTFGYVSSDDPFTEIQANLKKRLSLVRDSLIVRDAMGY